MLTVGEAKDSRLRRISGLCVDSPDFLELLNDAVRELMERGSWWGTLQRLKGCIYNNCIAWPQPVGTVLAFDRCGSVPPKNLWYEFNPVLPEQVQFWRTNGMFLCARDLALVDTGTTPVFNQIPCAHNHYVRVYVQDANDVGKTVTLFGIDNNGQEIITTRSDGSTQPGIVLTLAIPFVQTPFPLRRVDRVLKDITLRPLTATQFDGVNEFALATWRAGETNPSYRSSRLLRSNCTTVNCQQFPSMIEALVKLEYVPAVFDDDLVLIDNLDALAMAIQGIKLGDAYDFDGKERGLMAAVKQLNLQLRNKFPIDQTPARVKVFGTADLRRQGIGQLM